MKFLGLNISNELDAAISKRLSETKQSKTEFVSDLLAKELGIKKDSTLIERVEYLELKVEKIEKKLSD